jgi:DNA-binding NarL/FixJ family response regulator
MHLMSQPTPIAAYLQDDLIVDPKTVRNIMTSYTGQQIEYASLPRKYRDALRPSLTELVHAGGLPQEQLIYDARVVYGYKNVEIANALNIHPATVSKKFRRRQRLSPAA